MQCMQADDSGIVHDIGIMFTSKDVACTAHVGRKLVDLILSSSRLQAALGPSGQLALNFVGPVVPLESTKVMAKVALSNIKVVAVATRIVHRSGSEEIALRCLTSEAWVGKGPKSTFLWRETMSLIG